MTFRWRFWARRIVPAAARPLPVIPDGAMNSFERAFDTHAGTCRFQCACGVEYFDGSWNGGWTWERGELEALRAKMPTGASSDVGEAVGSVEFEGAMYAWDCPCWRPRATRVIAFLLGHDRQIAEFLSLERRRRTTDAEAAPEVRA